MVPIQDLLSRIRWDAAFGAANFALGYHDRHEDRILLVPFREVRWAGGGARSFQFVDAEGELRRIPLHRIRQVYRDCELIWERRP